MKKKGLALLTAAVMLWVMAGCGASDVYGKQEPVDKGLEADGFDSLESIVALAAENHKVYSEPNELSNVDLTPYAVNDTGLLTEEEMEALRTERSVKRVSVEEATADADLFFRTWKYAYSSYYFIGEDLFEAARQQVMTELQGHSGDVDGKEFAELLYDAMSFLRDCHSSIDGKAPANNERALVEIAYIDRTLTLDKDESGYYQTYDDGKWYYASASNSALRIEPALLENGKVVYCPVLLVPEAAEIGQDTLVLEKAGVTKEVPVDWKRCEDVSGAGSGVVDAQATGDVYYIDFMDMCPDLDTQYWGEYMMLCRTNTTGEYTALHGQGEELAAFLNTAKEAKNYKAVIFDLRHTGGYTHWQLEEWIRAFTGEEDSINETFLVRQNALRTADNFEEFARVSPGAERCDMWNNEGRSCKNDIPLIILTDKSCGSSVEEACLRLRTIENSIVIGSNTAGCALGGSTQTYYLPYSGVQFAIGGFMQLQGKAENIDGIGYEPDIWCDPADALACVGALLQRVGLTDEAMQTLPDPVDLELVFHDQTVAQGRYFGCVGDRSDGAPDEVYVTVDGARIRDFQVRSGNEELLGTKKGYASGCFLTRKKPFNGSAVEVIVTYDGNDYTFYACDDTWKG